MSKASHEQKERMKAPSEDLERGTGRFQLNGTDLEGPAQRWEAEGGDRFTVEVWHLLLKSQSSPTFRNGVCSLDLNL